MTPITDSFLKAFATDKLVLDCPHILLRQNKFSRPRLIEGKGKIFLPKGAVFFQLHVVSDRDVDGDYPPSLEGLRAFLEERTTAGEIVPPDQYFNLEATDSLGHDWTCKILKITTQDHDNSTITFYLYDVLTCRKSGLEKILPTLMSMYFFQDLKVPFTTFDAGVFKFDVQQSASDKGSTILHVLPSDGSLPEGIETRVEESLRYVTFSPIRWCIVVKESCGIREVTVAPKRLTKEARFYDPPIDTVDSWALFSAYFLHIVSFKEQTNYHPLSAQLFQLISTETQHIDLMGLLVSVAVEGVLSCFEFKGIAEPSATLKNNLDQIKKIINRLKCSDEILAKRLQGVLPGMKSSRAKDKLKYLEEIGLLTGDMVRTWDKLRNTTTHASIRIDPTTIPANWNQCLTVYTMLNLLVFQAIGYSGSYRDFSSYGWPIRHHHKKSVARS